MEKDLETKLKLLESLPTEEILFHEEEIAFYEGVKTFCNQLRKTLKERYLFLKHQKNLFLIEQELKDLEKIHESFPAHVRSPKRFDLASSWKYHNSCTQKNLQFFSFLRQQKKKKILQFQSLKVALENRRSWKSANSGWFSQSKNKNDLLRIFFGKKSEKRP